MGKNTTKILWLQVLGLALVQGSIVLAWVVYNLYLGDLLEQFGFSAAFVASIILIENVLGMVMEPLMGGFSDTAQNWLGSKFPFISLGVILSSALLVAIPVVVIFGSPSGAFRWVLPMVLVTWSIAMTIFRSPALSLLGRYAYGSGLPQAASLLTVFGAIAGSLGPFAKEYILEMGPGVAFTLSSLCLLGAAATLRGFNPEATINPEPSGHETPQTLSLKNLALIFLAGLGVTFGSRLLMVTFPTVIQTVPDINVAMVMGAIFITVAIAALPAGEFAKKFGNLPSILIGLSGLSLTALGIMIHLSPFTAFGLAIAIGIFMSFVNNGMVPFAISLLPAQRVGLGLGIFFSGRALALNLFGTLFKDSNFPSSVILTAAIVGWGLALLTILLCRPSKLKTA